MSPLLPSPPPSLTPITLLFFTYLCLSSHPFTYSQPSISIFPPLTSPLPAHPTFSTSNTYSSFSTFSIPHLSPFPHLHYLFPSLYFYSSFIFSSSFSFSFFYLHILLPCPYCCLFPLLSITIFLPSPLPLSLFPTPSPHLAYPPFMWFAVSSPFFIHMF